MKKQRATITIIVLCSIFFMLLRSQLAPAGEGGKIAFCKFFGSNTQIVVTNENGENLVNLSKNNLYDFDPEWLPDGKYIAFVSKRDGNPEIYIMAADGSNQHRITNDQSDNRTPSFSPDGRKLAFTQITLQGANSVHKIFIINIDGQEKKFLTDGMSPNWSPDGKRIAFSKKEPDKDNWGIYLMDTDGNNQVNIANNGTDPDWSPDGKQIVFSSNREKGVYSIYKMDSNGQRVVQLIQSDGDNTAPVWSPDGQSIAYMTMGGEVRVIDADRGNMRVISDGGFPSWFDPAFASFAVEPSDKYTATWGWIKNR
jgi:Tol biopolymer transport system component